MSTIRHGEIEISYEPSEDIDTIISIVDHIRKLNEERNHRLNLEKNDYGHDFGRGYRCTKCNMTLKFFHMNLYENSYSGPIHKLLCNPKQEKESMT